MTGLQCFLRLWLNEHDQTEWEEPEPGSAEDVGIEVGRMARSLFPGGILVEEEPWQHSQAVARTTALMADSSVSAIFEAAFEHSSVRIRRCFGAATARVLGNPRGKKQRRAGVRVSSIEILHVNKKYVRGKDGISWSKFFSRADVKRETKKRLTGIDIQLKQQLRCLGRTKAPKVDPDSHCHSPNSCEHWERCTASKPAD